MEENLKKLLTNPFDGKTDFQNECMRIANDLFSNYGIKCGNKIFRFAEIEFYYYKKGIWQDKWNMTTYYRDKKAGEMFFHYSGVDICFHSDSKNEFGGILIRSMVEVDKDEKFVALHKGPMICANLMLNSCEKTMPFVSKEVNSLNYEGMIQPEFRYGVDEESHKDEENKNLRLCFFVNQYECTKFNWHEASKILSWNKQKGELKESNRYYNRFKK